MAATGYSVDRGQAGASTKTSTTRKSKTANNNKHSRGKHGKNHKVRKKGRQARRAAVAVRFALRQRGKPYAWGGTGPYAYDCSGLVVRSWRAAGVRLPRVTYAQYAGVRKKVWWRHLKPGDLVFFNGRGHVGLYIGKRRMIHSPQPGQRVGVVRLTGYFGRGNFAGAVRPGG